MEDQQNNFASHNEFINNHNFHSINIFFIVSNKQIESAEIQSQLPTNCSESSFLILDKTPKETLN